MALNATALSSVIASGLGISTTAFTDAYARGIIASIEAATFAHAVVTGVAPSSGGALTVGTAIGGIISISPSQMEAITDLQFPLSPQINPENAAICSYIGTGLVSFTSGKIIGTCTNTSLSSGILASGAGVNGTILGLNGTSALAAVTSALGTVGYLGLPFYNALINYINSNAVCAYASGSVTAAISAGGGAVTGIGIGGKIT